MQLCFYPQTNAALKSLTQISLFPVTSDERKDSRMIKVPREETVECLALSKILIPSTLRLRECHRRKGGKM